ncbi:ABC transporter substrate-binding protein [Methanothrix sp.]|uniref:ABC transporter substrate-binding protein n=1 Tax=Methanothrix sp. TaxID=90426 RepID=UPI0034E1BB7D
MSRWIKILCTAVLISLLLPAVAEDIPVYTIADTTGDWGYPSPYLHYSRGPGYVRMSFIFDTLVWKDQNGFVPALAESWEYLKDENAYLFKLNPNAKWHDGEAFTADDVVFTINYIKEHPYQWVDSSSVDRAEKIDDHTVKIYLTKPYAPFLDQVAGTLPILPEHIYSDVTNPEDFQDKRALTGTGPFKLVDYSKAQGTYLYEANDDYYQGAPKVKQLKFVKLSEEMSGPALRRGEVDAASVPPEVAEGLRSSFVVLESAHDWLAKLMINHKKEPFSDVRFRQALAYAIDREKLVEIAQRGYGVPASPGLFAPDSEWYNPDVEQYAHDPEKAGDLLKEMGYEKKGVFFEKDGKTLEVELLVTSSNERAGELIKNDLEAAGIKVNMRSVDSKTLDNAVNEWKFDLALSGHGGMGGDPAILNKVITGAGFNSARYDDPELSDLLRREIAEMDPEKRRELVNEIQEVYARKLPALPLYYPTTYWAHDGKVDLFYTKNGVGSGVPIPLNKLAFLA